MDIQCYRFKFFKYVCIKYLENIYVKDLNNYFFFVLRKCYSYQYLNVEVDKVKKVYEIYN